MLLNLVKNQRPDIDKDSIELKHQLLINGKEKVEIKKSKNPKTFTDYSQIIDVVYENLEDYNPTKKRTMLSI